LALLSVLAAGCTTATRESTQSASPADEYLSERGSSPNASLQLEPARAAVEEGERVAVPWKPKFIPTGLSSGVMIEFTGMKKDRPVNARFASIELQQAGSSAGGKVYTSTINSLRQAFFKVPPGTYTLRQIKAWADPVVVRDLVVQEGQYSLLYIAVLNPRTARTREGVVE
jgi:hypothetical protein